MINNLNKAISDIKKAAEAALEKADEALEQGIKDIVAQSKSYAPDDIKGNPIANGISYSKNGLLDYTYVSQNPYSAYFEFGTGRYAREYLPKLENEWQELASKYIVNRKGTIPEISFIYPSIKKELPNIIDNINKKVNEG